MNRAAHVIFPQNPSYGDLHLVDHVGEHAELVQFGFFGPKEQKICTSKLICEELMKLTETETAQECRALLILARECLLLYLNWIF